MSDTYRRYRAIKQGIMQFYQPLPSGRREKHLNTLVALICGLVGGKQAQLPIIAAHAPCPRIRQQSLTKRFQRWLQNKHNTLESWFLPVAKELLACLAHHPIRLVMDGSVVGRGCLALMLSVVYHGRALPLCWVVVKAEKGHFPQDTHRALLSRVREIMPERAQVTFLGDGEFDGTELQADLRRANWQYVCRTASNILVSVQGRELTVADIAPTRGEALALSPAYITAKHFGPLSVLAIWEQAYQEPIYLVTNLLDLNAAVRLYKERVSIETFFSDLKSRGFHIQKSHMGKPERLCRLLIACCLAYIWMIYLGVCALQDSWMRILHRRDRCDLSLFSLGSRLLAYALNEHLPIPEGFLVPPILPGVLIRSFHKRAA
jgi:hypothetical protein